MDEGFDRWVCKLSDQWVCDVSYCQRFKIADCNTSQCQFYEGITLEILMNARRKLNQESDRWTIIMDKELIHLIDYKQIGDERDIYFKPINYNNSETEALKAALMYVYENKND